MQTTKYLKKFNEIKILAQNSSFDRLLNECTVTVQKTGNVHSFAKPTTTQCGLTFELICAVFLEHMYPGCLVYHISELPSEIQELTGLSTKDIGIDLIMIHNNMLYPVQCKLRSLTWNPIVRRMCSLLLARELKTFFKASENPVFSHPIVCTSATSVSGRVDCIHSGIDQNPSHTVVFCRNDFQKVFTHRGV